MLLFKPFGLMDLNVYTQQTPTAVWNCIISSLLYAVTYVSIKLSQPCLPFTYTKGLRAQVLLTPGYLLCTPKLFSLRVEYKEVQKITTAYVCIHYYNESWVKAVWCPVVAASFSLKRCACLEIQLVFVFGNEAELEWRETDSALFI